VTQHRTSITDMETRESGLTRRQAIGCYSTLVNNQLPPHTQWALLMNSIILDEIHCVGLCNTCGELLEPGILKTTLFEDEKLSF
jgi:hypothetical protein